MGLTALLTFIGSILAIATAVAFVASFVRGRFSKDQIQTALDTIDLQSRKILALEDDSKLQRERYEQKAKEQDGAIYINENKIRELQNEINVVKTLPLAQLSNDYHKVADTLNLIAKHVSIVNKLLENQQSILQDQQNMLSFFYNDQESFRKAKSGNRQMAKLKEIKDNTKKIIDNTK